VPSAPTRRRRSRQSTAFSWAAIGQGAVSAPALVADQSEAQITAEPTTADVTNILNSNSSIKTAFTNNDPSPLYFGIGELGGAYSSSGAGSETETSSIDMTVDLTKAGTLHDLIIGFYSGTVHGTITGDPSFSMTIDVNINGKDNKNTFTSITGVGGANAFFQDHAVDYGALSGSTLQLDISLSITESSAASPGGGYDFGMLIGDPPPLGHAAASFPPGSGANAGGAGPPARDNASWLGTHHAVTQA
jgi:hypothetical protein